MAGAGGAPGLLAAEVSRSGRDRTAALGGQRTGRGRRPPYPRGHHPALRKELPDLLAQAEAVARSPTGSRWWPHPDRYRIFYAGRAEWRRWYGGGRPRWTAGYAVTVGDGRHEVVLNAAGLVAGGSTTCSGTS